MIVVIIDALRFDHLNCYGYQKLITSPNIDKLAEGGILFMNAFSQAPWTKPSIASLFTSSYPSQHGVFEGSMLRGQGIAVGDVLDDTHTTIAEVLKDHGYITAAFIDNPHLSSYLGFSQGFLYYNERLGTAEQLTSRIIEFLRGRDVSKERFFLYIHYFDPHLPFISPSFKHFHESRSTAMDWTDYKFIRENIADIVANVNSGKLELTKEDVEVLTDLYDSEIYYTDYHLGILFNFLRHLNSYDNTLIFLSADHGEMLNEHHKLDHPHSLLYDQLLHVPLIVKLPTPNEKVRKIGSLVSAIDIMPTILDYLSIPIEMPLMGKSLLPAMSAPSSKSIDGRVFAEGMDKSVQIRTGKYKYIESEFMEEGPLPGRYLIDLEKDPHETTNIIDARKDLAAKFQKELLKWKSLAQKNPLTPKRKAINEEDINRLKSLGYIK